MKPRSKWKSRGIFTACLIAGLLIGFGAGFFIQRELKQSKAKTTSSKTGETAEKKVTTTAPKPSSMETSPTPASTVPAVTTSPAAQLITASTPAQAIREYLKTKGVDGSTMYFSVVTASKTDPNWKLDKGTKGNTQPLYFVLHHVTGGWAVVEHGTGLTAEKLSEVGAPTDLLTSAVPK